LSNWETFILVAVALGGTVAPFVVIVVAGLADSKETYSVLYKAREFRNSFSRYFLSMDAFLAYIFIFIGGMVGSIVFNQKITSTGMPGWCGYALLGVIALICLSGAAYILYLSVNYWEHDKNIVLAFEPETRTIFVSTDSQEYVLKQGDILKVVAVENGHTKIQFRHYRFFLNDGEEFVLTGKTKGVLAIFEYFKKIPVQYQNHWLPIVS
jgi:hypothetical protein